VKDRKRPRTILKTTIGHVAVGSAVIALLTFACYRSKLDFASAIPLYLLVVVLHSLTGNFRSSAIVAALSAGCLDAFFTEPLFSIRITDPLNGLALVAFTVTTLVITRLVTRVRKEAASSQTQKERLDRLYQLAGQLLALDPEEAIGAPFLKPFQQYFGITALAVFDGYTSKLYCVGHSGTDLGRTTRDAYILGRESDDLDLRVTVRCLRVGGRITGAIGFEDLEHPLETSLTLSTLSATFIERVHAFHRSSENAAAAQTEVYRSAVLDALAHEFKTPLATILAAVGGIRESGRLGSQQEEMAEMVESEAARLGSLTSRLLRTARLDREEVKPRTEPVDVASLVASIVGQYSVSSSDRRIVLASGAETLQVQADVELLRLAVNQLVENACKYSLPGSTVTVEIERGEGLVATRVSNNGSSILREERHRLFDRFYRGADAKRCTSGSGLGLYVARKIAIAHGGALHLESDGAAEERVTFCLTLPTPKGEWGPANGKN
jgi:two-component system sensor histidine kinase KdpD